MAARRESGFVRSEAATTVESDKGWSDIMMILRESEFQIRAIAIRMGDPVAIEAARLVGDISKAAIKYSNAEPSTTWSEAPFSSSDPRF